MYKCMYKYIYIYIYTYIHTYIPCYLYIIYVLVFVTFLVRLKVIYPFKINRKGYFKDNSVRIVGNDEFGHIIEPTRTFPVDKTFGVLQLLFLIL